MTAPVPATYSDLIGALDSLDAVPSLSGLTVVRRGFATPGSTMHPDGFHGRHARAGFIVGLRMPGADGRPTLHRFATYTGARTTQLAVDDERVHWSLRAKTGETLEISAERGRGGLLHAPGRTQFDRT